MLEKTLGIVLHNVKYADNSRIINIYTEKYGRMPFIANFPSKKKCGLRIVNFQNASILELDISNKARNTIQRIKDAKPYYNYQTIPFDVNKSAIIFFLSEIFSKTLNEESGNSELFNFIKDSLIFFDKLNVNVSFFHHIFLIELSKHLGFEPLDNYSEKYCYFDFTEGSYTDHLPLHSSYFNKEVSSEFYKISSYSLNNIENEEFKIRFKTEILEGIIEYYKIHFNTIKDIVSYKVLKDVFNV
ncbi:MAG: DNA repair protein RecO [Bacteroidetes bacterium GWA2_30_7]|nr:MAG: DNA repair protein RecO [Bacteroidetes bacterium GWA2_30_7]